MVKITIKLRDDENNEFNNDQFLAIINSFPPFFSDYLFLNYQLDEIEDFNIESILVQPNLNRIIINLDIPELEDFNGNHFKEWFNMNRVGFREHFDDQIIYIIDAFINQIAGKRKKLKRKTIRKKSSNGKRKN